MLENNLFTYATGELSQDAFICWLISFINNKDGSPLYNTAKDLLDLMFQGENIQDYETVTISRQTFKIDVLLIVNNRYAVIIEDKTFTSEGKDQIQGYKQKILENRGTNAIPMELDERDVICVYYKIVEQDKYNNEYVNISRKDMLSLLEKRLPLVESDIYRDYCEYIKSIHDETLLYKTLPIEAWRDEHNHIYKGFFAYLQNNVIRGNCGWHYVPNANNGFWGLWWHGLSNEILKNIGFPDFVADLYLQIEDNYICVKATIENGNELPRDFRSKIFSVFETECNKNNVAFMKKRARNGVHITIGYIQYNYGNHIQMITLMENIMDKIEKEGL